MAAAKELLQMDLYGLLDVEEGATEKEVKKAYRQKALTCHPDKNPDNPKAAELFHQLSQALEVLTDAAARAAYDKIRKAKKQAEERTRRLDDKRKKIKLDLEAREREAEAQSVDEIKVARTLEEEIAWLREEGSRQLLEEQKLIKEQIQREREAKIHGVSTAPGTSYPAQRSQSNSNVTPKLKLKWKSKKEDETNGGYSQDILFSRLKKYGDVLNVLVSSKKKGCAVVEFATLKGAELAFKNEVGLTGNPLKISWLEGQPEVMAPRLQSCVTDDLVRPTQILKPYRYCGPKTVIHTELWKNCTITPLVATTPPSSQRQAFTAGSDWPQIMGKGSLSGEQDYESLVLMRMRQAAKRQRLFEEMQKEDEEEAAQETQA